MNQLFYGDNLTIMRNMKVGSVDLIYLDPPFNSNRNYNLMYRNLTGRPVPEQVEAFCDTWEMDAQKEDVARNMPVLMRDHKIDHYYIEFWRLWMNALRYTQPRLMAYLIYMVERLLQMKVILKSGGSIYLHCDPTASHYIKVMMDAIFGHQNFRNEIIWCYRKWSTKGRQFCGNHDSILFYSGKRNVFNVQYVPTSEKTQKRWGGKKQRAVLRDGIRTSTSHDDELAQSPCPDWWEISIINPNAKERLGYPTQKPGKLLDRIIKASSNEGDVVFDPFCGCGTTVYSAERNNRTWIGCDIAILAVKLVRDVLQERHNLTEGHDFKIDGVPVSTEQALDLFKRDPFQFQHWAVERAGGFPSPMKVADRGIDGHVYFETASGQESMVLSVKGGNIRPTDIRDLRGVLEREQNAMAGFISMREPSPSMKREAASAGSYRYMDQTYPKIQMLTVQEMMDQKRGFETPTKIGSKFVKGQVAFKW